MLQQFEQFVINHWPQWLLFFTVLIVILFNEYKTKQHSAKQLSVAEVVSFINTHDAKVFDLREKEPFQKGHIIDSVNALAADFEQKYAKYKEKPLVLVCSQGQQSLALATALRAKGFVQPVALAGGIAAWQNAGLPLIKGK